MEAYFDNSATTRCFDEVKDIVCKTMIGDFGNPSAMHKKGMEAENYVRKSAQTLAKLLKVNEKEILFTSGGTGSQQAYGKPYHYNGSGACGSGSAFCLSERPGL